MATPRKRIHIMQRPDNRQIVRQAGEERRNVDTFRNPMQVQDVAGKRGGVIPGFAGQRRGGKQLKTPWSPVEMAKADPLPMQAVLEPTHRGPQAAAPIPGHWPANRADSGVDRGRPGARRVPESAVQTGPPQACVQPLGRHRGAPRQVRAQMIDDHATPGEDIYLPIAGRGIPIARPSEK
jgi:hypothetical protein